MVHPQVAKKSNHAIAVPRLGYPVLTVGGSRQAALCNMDHAGIVGVPGTAVAVPSRLLLCLLPQLLLTLLLLLLLLMLLVQLGLVARRTLLPPLQHLHRTL